MNNYQSQRPTQYATGWHLTEDDRARRLSRRKKIQRQRRILFGGFVVALAAFVLMIVLLAKSYFGSDVLTGSWNYDGNTIYQFDGKGNGAMILPSAIYDFTYNIDGDQIRIDFKNETVHDGTYTFTVTGNKLIIVGGEGTISGTYELAKE